MKAQLLIAAGGMGRRLGSDSPKALVDLAGAPLVVRTLERFSGVGLLMDAVIVVPHGHKTPFKEMLNEHLVDGSFSLVEGGAERQASVANGLRALEPDTDTVVIHDAARPFVSEEAIKAAVTAAAQHGAATVAIPCIDTILEGDGEDFLARTPDREGLWACQTPQAFQVDVVRRAHAEAVRQGFLGTDDATLVRRSGGRVKLIPGSPLNFKVTTPADLALAGFVFREGLA